MPSYVPGPRQANIFLGFVIPSTVSLLGRKPGRQISRTYLAFLRQLPLFKLNFGVITLLPKKENAVQIQQYRPICLLNVSFKIFTKVAANCITKLADKIIRPTQTTFMPGRHILEGVVVLHETIHELHRKKLDGMLFKTDFEKAYDKVKWPFYNKLYI
jgi:hypothetical protein